MKLISKLYYSLCAVLGTEIRDYRSGEKLGKALFVCWRGKVYVLGYKGKKSLVAMWRPEKNLQYSFSCIVFTSKTLSDD